MPGPDDILLSKLSQRRSYKWRTHDADVLPVHVAEMDLPTAEPIRRVLADMVAHGDFGYAVPGDLPEVYADFALWRYGQRVDPADVHLVGDVSQGIYLALRLLLAPGDGVVICPPVYYPFFSTIPAAGCRVVEVPLGFEAGRYDLDLAGLETAFAAGAGAFLLCSPHNPVGRVWTAHDLTAVADLADRYGVLVIADEIHAPLTFDGARFVPFRTVDSAGAARSVTLASASKAWNLPGLKTALAVTGSRSLGERWAELPELAGAAASILGVAASRAAFLDGRPWLQDTVGYLQGNRDHLLALIASTLPGVRAASPEATYLAWLDCRDLGVGEDPAARFLQHGRVALEAGVRFGQNEGAGFARLNFGTSRALVTEAVRRMAAAV